MHMRMSSMLACVCVHVCVGVGGGGSLSEGLCVLDSYIVIIVLKNPRHFCVHGCSVQ